MKDLQNLTKDVKGTILISEESFKWNFLDSIPPWKRLFAVVTILLTFIIVNIVLFSGFFKTLFIMIISLVIFVIIRISEMVRQTLQEENL